MTPAALRLSLLLDGYRAEFKLYRPLSGQFTKVFTKTEGGIFFQFGKH